MQNIIIRRSLSTYLIVQGKKKKKKLLLPVSCCEKHKINEYINKYHQARLQKTSP